MLKNTHLLLASVLTAFLLPSGAAGAAAQVHSDLWGNEGELWNPAGRLPDFSFAGYHSGEQAIPDVKAVANVTDFGAIGDGKTDCTQAFRDAIAATASGAITIPPGRYILSDILWIEKPGIVLRGAGPDKTELHVVTELEDVRPNMQATTSGKPTSGYSWSGGFLWVKGWIGEKKIAAITSENHRGDTQITLDHETPLKPGQLVTIIVKDDAQKSLLNHLYDNDPGNTDQVKMPIRVKMVNRIAAVHGPRITMERPLRFDIRPAWDPVLTTFTPSVSEVGIEDLAVTFPEKPYGGHFSERGMNAIALNDVANCWVRNVRISNSDSGLFLGGVFCSASDVVIDSHRAENRGATGHHGISLGTDCLVENFDFQTHFIHDFTLDSFKAGNVIKNGRGTNLSLDHHKKAPFANLFCNVDVGGGSEIWRCGGGSDLGKNCGIYETFWAIKSKQNIAWPPESFAPDAINLVGIKTAAEEVKTPKGKWLETMSPASLEPKDLHAAQLARRLQNSSGSRIQP